MLAYIGQFTVIQPRPPDPCFIEMESERTHQVQRGAGIAAQANDIACIGRDFGLVKHHVQHDRVIQ